MVLLSPFDLLLINITGNVGSIAWRIQPIMRLICAFYFNPLLQSLGLMFHCGLLAMTKPVLITQASFWAWDSSETPFCCLVIIALCMYNQLCAFGRQNRGTMTFRVQGAIAPWKQITWLPRGFTDASFNATLATPSVQPSLQPARALVHPHVHYTDQFQYNLPANIAYTHTSGKYASH